MIILTDLFGGTPSNLAISLMKGENIEVIAGVNLPMLIRALNYRNEPLASVLEKALAGATDGVTRMAATGECA